ncbi:NACHT domain-containing protein [Saccharothrix variisporea]|uniref:NACHT domain-containing protein n=1 Tax=Saccharothrix variisporea TaxID=543527 RepID=A0A495XFQ4_9PSEU|nr:NACHT domain-containing protein [Saccharothrix variisporea]RKT72827.1 NACHT domain-containing protein [Saccharothrix variisporea]
MLTNLGWSAALITPVVAGLLFVPRALWRRWRDRIVERLDSGLRRRVSRFGRHYRRYMLTSFRYADLKGLFLVGPHTPRFDEVYVDVGLAAQTPHNAQTSLLARLPAGDRHALTDLLGHPEPVVLAVIGVPGSGKTTLLRHVALAVAGPRRSRRRIPVLLYLRDHVTAIVADAALPDLVRAQLVRFPTPEPPGWFEQRLRAGDCVVLLDGLDEVASPEDRRRVSAWVERQVRQYPRNDFVLTSRPQGYRTAPVSGATVLQVRDFTDEQVNRFVRGWYAAMERLSTGDVGEAVRLRAEKAADELLDKLHATPTLDDLSANPLLLTMVANVHRFGSKLPDSRAELYREICEVVLWRRHEAKDLPVRLDGHRKEVVLQTLAHTMMTRRVRDLARSEVLDVFRPVLRRMSTSMTEELLLEDVSSNGLLVERESGEFSFAHQTFQEYLAAVHVRQAGDLLSLAAVVDDDWWRETTVLAVARTFADPVVHACLESGTVAALSLAFECAEVCSELSPELRGRLDAFVDSDDPERRRLVAGIALTRFMRERVVLGDGVAVCSRPVPNSLYRLYLLDNDRPVPPGLDPEAPARGVWATEARDFTRWATEVVGGSTRYRLPTRTEVDHPAARRVIGKTGHRYWLEGGDRVAYIYRKFSGAMVREYLRADLEVADCTGLLTLLHLEAVTSSYLADLHRRSLDPPPPMPERLSRDFALFSIPVGLTGVDTELVELSLAPTWAEAIRSAEWLQAAVVAARLRLVRLHVDVPVVEVLGLARQLTSTERFPLHPGDRAPFEESPVGQALAMSIERGTEFADALVGIPTHLELVPEKLAADARATPLKAIAWDIGLPDRLRAIAEPVFAGRRTVTPELATAIRVGAALLAVDLHGSDDALRYWRMAAGATLLQRRAAGDEPADETIVLAVDRRTG